MRLPAKWFITLALLVLTVAGAACDSKNLPALGRSAEQLGIEAGREVAFMQKAGEIEEDAARKFTTIFNEVEANGHNLSLIDNWKAMPATEKRRTIVEQIALFEQSARRLDAAGVLGIKTERARRRVETFKRNFQRGLSLLRLIEAAVPVEPPQPQVMPAPAVAPGQ